MLLIGAFAVAALALAIVGVYGVIAYSVAQRTRELALRVALGATDANVIALILKRGALLAAIGIGIGVGAALVLSRFLGALLFDVSSSDAATYAGVVVGLGAVALLASYVPSRRATRVDPATALRAD
jgi:ABC-type antimicrobial peptide transport system permease subunit